MSQMSVHALTGMKVSGRSRAKKRYFQQEEKGAVRTRWKGLRRLSYFPEIWHLSNVNCEEQGIFVRNPSWADV